MVDPQSIKRRQSKNSKKVLDMFNHLVSQRLKQREDGKVHNDMLDAMLNISNDNKYMDKNMIEHLSHVINLFSYPTYILSFILNYVILWITI